MGKAGSKCTSTLDVVRNCWAALNVCIQSEDHFHFFHLCTSHSASLITETKFGRNFQIIPKESKERSQRWQILRLCSLQQGFHFVGVVFKSFRVYSMIWILHRGLHEKNLLFFNLTPMSTIHGRLWLGCPHHLDCPHLSSM